MTTSFDRWEKDPFFSAAEEVQESADRMESAYRRWMHARKIVPESDSVSEELRRELHTTLGTAKWQLEEFEQAVRSSYGIFSADDARSRHHQFIVAIGNQISLIEGSLREAVTADGKTTLPWVRLDEGERDELALFLVGPMQDAEETGTSASGKDGGVGNPLELLGPTMPESSEDSSHLLELGSKDMKEERLNGHRRTASASADLGALKITVADEEFQRPPPRILSFSNLLWTAESKSKLQWSKNGFRKWKGGDRQQAEDTEPLRSHQFSQGINACYERSKSCLDGCDGSYNKHLNGWLGAFQRQLQRSQYQIQYCRPVQMAFWVILVLCLIVLFVLRTF